MNHLSRFLSLQYFCLDMKTNLYRVRRQACWFKHTLLDFLTRAHAHTCSRLLAVCADLDRSSCLVVHWFYWCGWRSLFCLCVCVWPLLHWWASSPVGPWACACLFSQLVDYIWPKMAMERSWSLQRCPGLLFRPDSCRHSASSSKLFDGSSISFCHGEGSCKIFHVLVLITVWLDLHACSKIIALLMVWFHCWNHFYWWA